MIKQAHLINKVQDKNHKILGSTTEQQCICAKASKRRQTDAARKNNPNNNVQISNDLDTTQKMIK